MRRFFSAGMSCTPVVARAAAGRPVENPTRPRRFPGAAERYERSAKGTILPMSASPPGGGRPAGPVDTVAHPALSGIPRYCGFSLSWPLRVVGMGWVLFKLHTGRGVSHGQANGKQK